jgi:hypothetical protein
MKYSAGKKMYVSAITASTRAPTLELLSELFGILPFLQDYHEAISRVFLRAIPKRHFFQLPFGFRDAGSQ